MSSGVAQDPGDTSYLHVFPHHPKRPVDFTTLLRGFPALAQETGGRTRALRLGSPLSDQQIMEAWPGAAGHGWQGVLL